MSAILITYSTLGDTADSGAQDIFPIINLLEEKGVLTQVISRTKRGLPVAGVTSAIPVPVFYLLRFLEKVGFKLTRNFYEKVFDLVASVRLRKAKVVFFHGGFFLPRTLARAKQLGATAVEIARTAHPATNAAIEKEEYAKLNLSLEEAPYIRLQKKVGHLKSFDWYIVHSEFVRDSYIENGASSSQVDIVPLSVNTSILVPAQKQDTTFRVAYVAYTTPLKGLHYLLDAWSKCSFAHAELLIVGGFAGVPKKLYQSYQEHLSKDSSIIDVGSTKDLVSIYQQASVLVLPSLTEGFGRVGVEAMACGVPVITTENARGLVEDGKNGFVVPIRNSKAIKEKLEAFYNNRSLVETMGRSARKAVLSAPSIEDTVWDIYNKSI